MLSFAKTIHHDYIKLAHLHEEQSAQLPDYYRIPRMEKTVHYEYDFDIGLRSPHTTSA
jgi:hypothetical protein